MFTQKQPFEFKKKNNNDGLHKINTFNIINFILEQSKNIYLHESNHLN